MTHIPRSAIRPQTDFYPTPPEATRALLSVERFSGRIWEPCAGDGAMYDVLAAAGYPVMATTIEGTDSRSRVIGDTDFLMVDRLPENCGAIVTNPPFRIVETIVQHALDLDPPKICMLLNIKFLSGVGRCRGLFAMNPPSRVHVFADRVTMYPGGYDGPKGTTTETMMWAVWDSSHIGAPTIGWLIAGDHKRGGAK